MSGDIHVVPLDPAIAGVATAMPKPAVTPAVEPDRPATTEAPEAPEAPDVTTPTTAADPRLDILRALERGDIDVAEASRRLATMEARDA